MLRPGGTLAFCGEPSRYGDLIAAVPKRAALTAPPLWRRLVGASRRDYEAEPDANGHALEPEVDVHAFSPGDLRRLRRAARLRPDSGSGRGAAGQHARLDHAHARGGADPEQVPWGWRRFAFRTYIALQRLDTRVLEPRLPPQLFYNLLISARKG